MLSLGVGTLSPTPTGHINSGVYSSSLCLLIYCTYPLSYCYTVCLFLLRPSSYWPSAGSTSRDCPWRWPGRNCQRYVYPQSTKCFPLYCVWPGVCCLSQSNFEEQKRQCEVRLGVLCFQNWNHANHYIEIADTIHPLTLYPTKVDAPIMPHSFFFLPHFRWRPTSLTVISSPSISSSLFELLSTSSTRSLSLSLSVLYTQYLLRSVCLLTYSAKEFQNCWFVCSPALRTWTQGWDSCTGWLCACVYLSSLVVCLSVCVCVSRQGRSCRPVTKTQLMPTNCCTMNTILSPSVEPATNPSIGTPFK